MASQRSAIVFTFDRLGAGYLGPYGGTWVDTPAMNRLAASSTLFEWAISDCPQLDSACQAWWFGQHALCPAPSADDGSLLAAAKEAKIPTILLTDDAAVRDHPLAALFEDCHYLKPATAERANSIEETHLARITAEGIALLHQLTSPALVWIHARAMEGPWDAPLEYREQLHDEEDPAALDWIDPPSTILAADYDPDERFGLQAAYAAQVGVLDACLDVFLDGVEESAIGRDALLLLTSPRGYPLGEHLHVGEAAPLLHEELLHLPLLIRKPAGDQTPQRSPLLAQPSDLCATLAAWLGLPGPAPGLGGIDLLSPMPSPPAEKEAPLSTPSRDRAVSVFEGQQSLRLAKWLWQREAAAEGAENLYVKPDDRWEVNEISDRCQDITEAMRAAAHDFQQKATQGQLNSLAPLNPILK